MSAHLIDQLNHLSKHNGFYVLSELKEWAKTNKINCLDKPLRVPKGNWMAVFPRSYNQSYQVYIHNSGQSLEISAI